MTTALPPVFATNTNYSSGPDSGTPTKVDPGSPSNGFVAGTAIAPQHVNYLLHPIAAAARRAFAHQALSLRRVELEGTAITDTAASMAAACLGEGYNVVAVKTAQSFGVGDCGRLSALGVPPSITSLVNGAAMNPATGRILIIGAGGNRCAYSDDAGENWTAGADTGLAAADAVVWNAVKSVFIISQGTTAKRSADGTAWSSGTISNGSNGGLAVLANGDTVAAGDGLLAAFSISSDGGATWADASGTIPNAASSPDGGSIAGNGGNTIYHVARLSTAGVDTFQISSSTDGSNWGLVKTFAMPHVGATAFRPRLLMCQNTGLLVAVMQITPALATGRQTMLSASIDGIEWSDPLLVADAPSSFGTNLIDCFAVAGGRLLLTVNDMMFASAGIGF